MTISSLRAVGPMGRRQGDIYRAQMKVVKYLGFRRPFADSKGLCGATPKYLTYAEHGGIFLRHRLSETLITLLTINASTFERYQSFLKYKPPHAYIHYQTHSGHSGDYR